MAFKATEITIRTFLLDELKKKGVKIGHETTFPVKGTRKQPDAVLENGAQYVLLTKLGGEAKHLEDVLELTEYITMKHLPIKGAIAVLMPGELRRSLPLEALEQLSRDPQSTYTLTGLFRDRNYDHRSGTLAQVTDWIAEHVLRPPEYVEPDTDFVVRVLSSAVDRLNVDLRHLEPSQLNDIFGGKSVFENILQQEEGKYPVVEMRKAATYLLINQLIFYHVLSREDPVTFEPIDSQELRHPADLSNVFSKVVRDVDYAPTFGFDVASRFPPKAIDTIRGVIDVIMAMGLERIKHEFLGKVFHNLIPFEVRKKVAAFYTKNEAACLLADLAIDKSDAEVIDLAVGSGTLLVAAYDRKRRLLEQSGESFLGDHHRRFVERELTGIDIMPFAAHLAVVHLSLQAPEYTTERIRVAVWDSVELRPGNLIDPIHKELKEALKRPTLEDFMEGRPRRKAEDYITKGVVTPDGIGGEQIALEKADVVIMNPPFTRQERLPLKYKEKLNRNLAEYENQIHGQLGMWGYFLLLADRFVKDGGKLALVYPGRFLAAKAAKELRNLLLSKYHIEAMITSWERSAFSESARYREILLIARKLRPREKRGTCKVISLVKLPRDIQEARDYAQEIGGLSSDTQSMKFNATMITPSELRQTLDNWFVHLSIFDPAVVRLWSRIQERGSSVLTTFKDFCTEEKSEIMRGVESKSGFGFPFYDVFLLGDESRALKKHDKWLIAGINKKDILVRERFTGLKVDVPYRCVLPALRRASGVETMDVSSALDHILVDTFHGVERLLPEDSSRGFMKHKSSWKKYLLRRVGKLLISRRFNISANKTCHLAFCSTTPTSGNNLWSFTNLSDEKSKILTLWFNSSINLLQVLIRRIETEGPWMEINEGMLSDFLTLDPSIIKERDKAEFLQLYEEIGQTRFPALMTQIEEKNKDRVKIDTAVLRVLGFSDSEANEILESLYTSLAGEIKRLRSLVVR